MDLCYIYLKQDTFVCRIRNVFVKPIFVHGFILHLAVYCLVFAREKYPKHIFGEEILYRCATCIACIHILIADVQIFVEACVRMFFAPYTL